MKKNILFFLLFILTACTPIRTKNEPEQKERYITDRKKNTHMVDLCAYENLPRYPYRPKLYPQELKNLTSEQLDARIKQHISALDDHIDKVERVVVDTRKRVELCR